MRLPVAQSTSQRNNCDWFIQTLTLPPSSYTKSPIGYIHVMNTATALWYMILLRTILHNQSIVVSELCVIQTKIQLIYIFIAYSSMTLLFKSLGKCYFVFEINEYFYSARTHLNWSKTTAKTCMLKKDSHFICWDELSNCIFFSQKNTDPFPHSFIKPSPETSYTYSAFPYECSVLC